MRSHASRIVYLIAKDLGLILLLALAIVGVSVAAHAQGGIWQVDAEHSIARLSLGPSARAVEVGIAPVSGTVAFDSKNAADPIVNLNVKPDKNLGGDYSDINFKSKRSEVTKDGKLAVVGDLSITRVERSVMPYEGGGDGYYGARYGNPVVHTDTREVTLVFPGASLPAAQNGAIRVSAATHISRERFPQLLTALELGNWPNVVVEHEHCAMPSEPPTEDYHGAICTGTQVETATNSVTTYAGGGDGYYGSKQAVVPDGSQATIGLDLQLTQLASAPSAASTAAGSAGN